MYKFTQETLARRSNFDRFSALIIYVFSHTDHDFILILISMLY